MLFFRPVYARYSSDEEEDEMEVFGEQVKGVPNEDQDLEEVKQKLKKTLVYMYAVCSNEEWEDQQTMSEVLYQIKHDPYSSRVFLTTSQAVC